MLEADDLVVLRNGGRRVLDGVSFRLSPGELVALEGSSGGGKTTLLWALARMLPAEHGTLRLEGQSAASIPVRTWRRRVALMIQKPALVEGTVGENLRLPWTLAERAHDADGPDAPPNDTLRRELDGLGLGEVGLDRPASELSVGQTSRVCFLRTLLTEPAALLLDEPGASLDAPAAVALHRRVAAFVEGGGSALLVRHHDPGVTMTRTLRLDAGRLEEEGS